MTDVPIERLRELAATGGPEPSDYPWLNGCFHDIAAAMRRGELAWQKLLDMWRQLGEPFSTTRTLQGHVVAKPYGYDGDFELIDKIYTKWISPDPQLANWDRFFHSQVATEAVRYRKNYWVELVPQLISSTSASAPYVILSAACGPGRDVYELCNRVDRERVFFHCVDRDQRALDYAQRLNIEFPDSVQFSRQNLVRFRAAARYNFIWGAGVFDYFDDPLFTATLSRLIDALQPTGRLVVANISPDNPSRDYMECGHWFLHHRTRDQLISLAVQAGVPDEHITVEADPGGVVNYMHITMH